MSTLHTQTVLSSLLSASQSRLYPLPGDDEGVPHTRLDAAGSAHLTGTLKARLGVCSQMWRDVAEVRDDAEDTGVTQLVLCSFSV